MNTSQDTEDSERKTSVWIDTGSGPGYSINISQTGRGTEMTRSEARRVLRQQYHLSSYAADRALNLAVVNGLHEFEYGKDIAYENGSWSFPQYA